MPVPAAAASEPAPASGPAIVAEVVRNGFVECRHHGSVLATDVDGVVAWSVGDVTSAMLPRSSNKPLQALGMVRLGLDLPPDLLALACASHSGEAVHLEGVRRILAGAGLDESALQTPPDLPLDDAARLSWLRSGGEPERVLMNCSGKHAAMLATCVANDWDTATYLDPDHPLQQGIAATFAEVTGEPVQVTAIDGCGAPLLSTSLTGLARAFRALAVATDGPERRIADAIRTHPVNVSGSTRDELTLLTAIPGAIGKAGAEGCYAVALPDGRTFALKVEDGAARARPALMTAALRRSGVLEGGDPAGADVSGVEASGRTPVLGGGEPVGEIRAVL